MLLNMCSHTLVSVCVCLDADKYRECALDSGQKYRGTASVTKSGSRCLPWDSPAVKRKMYNAWRSDALDLGLGSHSFCRYPFVQSPL